MIRGRSARSDPNSCRRGEAMEPVEAKDATRTAPSRAQREDFRATSDPALQEGGKSDVKLLDYTQLYNLWERQQWATQDLDFSQDRIDWHERIPEEERFQRMYGLSSFFIGEQKVADELGPIMRAACASSTASSARSGCSRAPTSSASGSRPWTSTSTTLSGRCSTTC